MRALLRVARLVRSLAPVVLVAAALLGPEGLAHAESTESPPKKHPHRWDPAWTHANAWDYTLTGVATTAAVVELTVLQGIRPTLRWSDPILFDSDVRSALMTRNLATRSTLEDAAWILWGLQAAYPVFVDVPLAWARQGKQLAWDMFWQDAVTLTIAGAVDGALRDIAGRARPDVYDCLQSGRTDCLQPVESTRSFPGGHFLNSTAASVLTCTQHLYLHLYDGAWDGVACALTLASNATLGVLRIVTDNHWATDELVGGAIGSLIGWGVPYVMHLHGHAPVIFGSGESIGTLVLPVPLVFQGGGGMSLTGIF